MKGAIFFSSKYGSTAQYAEWIGEQTGVPVFDTRDTAADPSQYDFLVIGCPILYYKVFNRKWIKRHLANIEGKSVVFFTVSGAPASKELDKWIAGSLPVSFISKVTHVALRGRQKPEKLSGFDRLMLKIAASVNKNEEAKKQELEGFDFMDKSSIEPIINLVRKYQLEKGRPSNCIDPFQMASK